MIRARHAALLLTGLVAGFVLALAIVAVARHAGTAALPFQMARFVLPRADVRRVVTGHDEAGRSVVLSDGAAPNIKRFADLAFIEIWRTLASPAPIAATVAGEPGDPDGGLTQPGGSLFRLVDYQPRAAGGQRTQMHRTETVDYAIVLQGEIVMVLDTAEVTLRAGDVVVQRGTAHAWENRSNAVTRMAFVLLDGAYTPELAAKMTSQTVSR